MRLGRPLCYHPCYLQRTWLTLSLTPSSFSYPLSVFRLLLQYFSGKIQIHYVKITVDNNNKQVREHGRTTKRTFVIEPRKKWEEREDNFFTKKVLRKSHKKLMAANKSKDARHNACGYIYKTLTSSKTISNKDNSEAGKPMAVFLMTATMGLLKLRIVWTKYLKRK